MSDHHTKQANEILKKIKYAVIATISKNSQPWNSPMAVDIDDKLTIYWASDKNSQHSENIRYNSDVFIIFFDSTVNKDGEAVYIEATASELNTLDEVSATPSISTGSIRESADNFLGESARRFYKAIPKRIWLNDVEMDGDKFIRDIRIPVEQSHLLQNW